MLVPLIRTLQKELPQAHLTWVISPPAYDLVANLDGVEFIVFDKKVSLKNFWSIKKQMQKRKFDVLLATQASLRANLLYPFIRAQRKIGYDKLRAKDCHSWFVDEHIAPGKDHTLEGFLKFAAVLGIQNKTIKWDLPIANEAKKWTQQFVPTNKQLILINPASSKAERSWLPERYIEVIKYIQNKWQAQVILTGGPAEHDKHLGNIIEKSVPVINLIGKTKPQQLLALIAAADLLICPDTGPAHMAAAVNTPVIALHAVTNPDISGPYTFRDLAVNAYPQAIEIILKKEKETNAWGTHVHGAETMKLVEVKDVLGKVDKILLALSKKPEKS